MSRATKPLGVKNGVTRQAVLDYLAREADLDGLVTVSEQEIADRFGFTQSAAGEHMRNLAAEGLLTYVGRSQGVKYRAIKAYQVADEVLA